MLTALSIRNVVLIDRLDLDFRDGLTVMTGETGAGKSILLDALGLAVGARASGDLLGREGTQASVAATFEVASNHPATLLLGEHGYETEGTVVLRRIVGEDGRTRAFANDQPASVGFLKRLGDLLVEIEGQFAQHGLLDEACHLRLLDAHGRLQAKAGAVAAAYGAWKAAAREREAAETAAAHAVRDEATLRDALDELERLDPQQGEEHALAETRQRWMHRERILEALSTAEAAIGQDAGVDTAVRTAQRALERVAEAGGECVKNALAALDRAAAELVEASTALAAAAEGVEMNAAERDRIEERLFALRETARKHRVTADELPKVRQQIADRLASIDDSSGRLVTLRGEEARTRDAYLSLAEALSAARAGAADRFASAVNRELPPLRLQAARFDVALERLPPEGWRASGLDRAAFHIATNPGAPAGSLARVASGGELARLLLAIKLVLATANPTPCLVFDEVDSGVGGATAAAVGERLAQLAASVQVLVVTHSPQVAALGNDHLLVRKVDAAERAVTEVIRLEGRARQEEIARMLSGTTITAEARAAATRLIAGAGA